ncbi:MAG: DNA internalization-related competence protein ComEC/Rec2 [Porticoccaceae bacterium]
MQQIYALLAFSAGVFVPNFYWGTLDYAPLFFAFIIVAGLFYRFRQAWLISFFIGLGYGTWSAISYDRLLLPDEFNNQKFLVEGEILGMPEQGARSWRFNLRSHSLLPVSSQTDAEFQAQGRPAKIRLGYYGNSEQKFSPGDELMFEARLRRPHGLMNRGLFDYQRWLVSESISSTGYISRLVEHKEDNTPGWKARIDRWRRDQSDRLQRSGVPRAEVQSALAVGDRRYVDAKTWDLFVDTGVVHLMVISGLHVSFVAGMAYFLGRWLLALMFLRWGLNSHRWANLAAIFAAFFYAGLAGFSTPTIRAVVMLSALLVPRFFFLKISPWWGLSLALAAISLLDPRAVLQTGFWLSFLAVVLIFLTVSSQKHQHFWPALIRLQLVFLIGFSGVILLVQGQLNPLSFIANLIAVPLTSLLVVPLEIFGLLSGLVAKEAGIFLWRIAGYILDFMIFLLARISELSSWRLLRQEIPFWLAVISAVSALTLFYWRKWWQKFVALLMTLPLVVPLAGEKFILEMRVFDVGQGLAVLVRQPGYSLVYDTGPKFSEEFDSGADILLPSIRRLGVSYLDDLVISHPDADHMGGYPGLHRGLAAENVWIGRHSEKAPTARSCLGGQAWQVGDVHYEFLFPASDDAGADVESDNDRSCVLQIRFDDQSILLPGDISRSAEQRLLAHGKPGRQALVVIPHHGSKSSSSPEFVHATSPDIAIASAGYLNRFGHPAPEVLARYRRAGARIFSTSENGMVRILWQDRPKREEGSTPGIETQAERRIFWWQK